MPPPPLPELEAELGKARDLGIDTCGRIAEFWGFTRTMGRTFGLLYLSHEPLPQGEIQKRLGISAGSASMTLSALGRWGVVHRVWVRGQRREHYQAETDFWKMISGVLNERERREIGAAVEAVQRAELGARDVAAAVKTASSASARRLRSEAEFAGDRLATLGEICRLGETMLNMLLGQLTLDVGRFRDVFKGDPGTAGSSAPPLEPEPAAAPATRPKKSRR
ncbi:MAG TPA: ArsR family transcriptional regulator [Polyangia bacterium]|nr:ArsR family transcriptional regulator [Polyangia bacterium]